MVHDTTRELVGICTPCCCPGSWWSSTSMWTYSVCAADWSLGDTLGLCCLRGHVDVSDLVVKDSGPPCHWRLSLSAAWVCVVVPGKCWTQKIWTCPWSVHAAWSHVDVHEPWRCWGPYWSEWPARPPEAILLSESSLLLRTMFGSETLLQLGAVFIACVVIRNHVEAHDPRFHCLWRARGLLLFYYQWLWILSWEGGSLLWQSLTSPQPWKYKSLDRKPLKRTLKWCGGDAQV